MGEEAVLALRDKRVAIVGISNSNIPLVRFLARYGIEMTVCDRKTPEELGERYNRIARLPVTFRHGPAYLAGLEDFDVVFLSPGIKRNQPELIAARNAGVRFTSEMELFFDLCSAPITGITGSAGKTTTTTLVAEIYRAAGLVTHVGGNISHSLVDQALAFAPDSRVVLELSSFQLQPLRKSPTIAAVTNISPNHLDVHASMDEYINAKKNIFRYQRPGDRLVLNRDDPRTRDMAAEAKGEVLWFSRREPVARGAFLRGEELVLRADREQVICRVGDVLVPGWHNIENILAAAALAGATGLAAEPVRAVATTFRGVEHRLQLVRVRNGVRWYNDSIATAPERTLAALATVPGPLVLILGGSDKKADFGELAAVVCERAHTVLLIGATADRIEAAIRAAAATRGVMPQLVRCGDYAEVVARAAAAARPGDAVLLSPACASYDMFENFEQRGKLFAELVNELP